MVICVELDADLHVAQLMPLLLTVSCFSKIQIGFTFLVPAHPVSPEKGPLNGCVCVMGMTAPQRRAVSEIPHPHAAHLPYYLNHDSDCDRFACQFMVLSFFGGGVVPICYIT